MNVRAAREYARALRNLATKLPGPARVAADEARADEVAWRELRKLLVYVLAGEVLVTLALVLVSAEARAELAFHGTVSAGGLVHVVLEFIPARVFEPVFTALGLGAASVMFTRGVAKRWPGRVGMAWLACAAIAVVQLALFAVSQRPSTAAAPNPHTLVGSHVVALTVARCCMCLGSSILAWRMARAHDFIAVASALLCAWLGGELCLASAAWLLAVAG
jgi:hypothetical protein